MTSLFKKNKEKIITITITTTITTAATIRCVNVLQENYTVKEIT